MKNSLRGVPAIAMTLWIAPAIQADDFAMEAGATTTFQATDESSVDEEWLASADLILTRQAGPGEWLVFVEGSTSLQPGAVASQLPEANADAGTALDRHGDGRLQVSELRYSWDINDRIRLHFGLLDATVFLDTSGPNQSQTAISFTGTANDETTQFLGGSFVNNPLIEFPDYALGAVIEQSIGYHGALVRGVVTSSNGLADNPDASYSELVNVSDDGKGFFAAGELHMQPLPRALLRLGIWANTADHEDLDGHADDAHKYGIYGVVDGPIGDGSWNLRLGWADPDVSAGSDFVAVAAEHPLSIAMLGAGLARTGISSQQGEERDDRYQAELYLRFQVTEHLFISPDLQYIENSGFENNRDAFVYGLRITGRLSAG